MVKKDIKKTFEQISRELDDVHRVLDTLLPYAIVRQSTTFGNSSHVVLPKSFVDKRVGVIILGEE